jgi:peptidyl-dipeptidase Dcp
LIRKLLVATVGTALMSGACATTPTAQEGSSTTAQEGSSTPAQEDTRPMPASPPAPTAQVENPLLARWTGPYGGVPAFDKVKVEHFKPALEGAMEQTRREIATIADNPAAPTFENTIAAMEGTARTYSDVRTFFGIWSSTMNGPEFQAIEREMAPKLAAFADEITQNEKLFRRIEAVYSSPEKAKLTAEQQRLTWVRYTDFVRAGAKLDAAAKKRMGELNQRLA